MPADQAFEVVTKLRDERREKVTKSIRFWDNDHGIVVCVANEHNYIGDGTIFYEKELEVGKEYHLIEVVQSMAIGDLVRLEEFPEHAGFQKYLFEEKEAIDVETYTKYCRNRLREALEEGIRCAKEGKVSSLKEVKERLKKVRDNRKI